MLILSKANKTGILENKLITLSMSVVLNNYLLILMAILVKWLTHRSVKPTCVGSSPTYCPFMITA